MRMRRRLVVRVLGYGVDADGREHGVEQVYTPEFIRQVFPPAWASMFLHTQDSFQASGVPVSDIVWRGELLSVTGAVDD